jgi:hypothetical protein
MNNIIHIDFVGGSHGNFLQFFCNRFLANIQPIDPLPFNNLGAAHAYKFTQPRAFRQNHYTTDNIKIPHGSQVISIQIDIDDLLAVQCISLLRAADRNIDPTDLSIDTWNKLNNSTYKPMLENLFNSFFKNQIQESYLQVMDTSWPMIETVEDFQLLPDHIKKECEEVHNLKLLSFGPDQPDCPESVLHEFFKIGFLNPSQHRFLIPMNYDDSCDVYRFPFRCFYDWNLFSIEIKKLSAWCNIPVNIDNPEVYNLHHEFLNRQPYKDIKSKCDLLVQQRLINNSFIFPELNIIERAYIDAQLEKQ